jgi:hypothetical protein
MSQFGSARPSCTKTRAGRDDDDAPSSASATTRALEGYDLRIHVIAFLSARYK